MNNLCGQRLWRTMGILSVILLASIYVFGQAELGTIAGVVRDTTGAVVADAKVTVTNTGTNAIRTSTTNNLGEYHVPQLPPAVYSVSVAKSGFQTYTATIEVAVGGHSTLDASLTVGSGNTVVEVVAGSAGTEVNTQTQELSQLVDTQQMALLPSLTRNPYDFVAISGNISNGDTTSNGASEMSGQETTLHGVGYSINGQRNTGTEILLDGVENIAVFGELLGEDVPLDAVQEYSIVTNNFSAEYGRASGGVVNVTSKTGSNSWHGSGWEFNRLSDYTANTYNNVANDLPKGTYTRNQFGFQVGGPVIKNKLFVSGSNEWIRVRSSSVQTEEVFDPSFTSMLPANSAAYFSAFATGAAPSTGTVVTAGQLATAGLLVNPINGVTPVAANQAVFDQVAFTVPFDAGGGEPVNQYDWIARADYNLSEKTQMFFRLGHEKQAFFTGTTSFSAYPQYDTGSSAANQSYLYSISHTFNSNLLNNTKVSFTRFNSATSFDQSLTFTPNLMFVSPVDPVDNATIQMPGLQNFSEPGVGGVPVGGPQNTLQLEHDLSWTKGRHNMKFGGQFTYIQLNYTYGAYNQAVEQLGTDPQTSMDDLVNADGNPLGSQLAGNGGFSARVNAEGALPCPLDQFGNPVSPCPSYSNVTPPLPPATAGRSYRYKDWATYAQDSFRFTPRLTFNYGLRYEHYGVQHNNHQDLDANFYYGAGSGLEEQVATGGVQLTQQSSVGQFWAPSWGTLAPRIGFAYDVFGDGKSSLRGGFGISYERNFGNVTYNASFNPPASAVLSSTCAPDNPACTVVVTNNDLGPLGLPGPTTNLTPVELRMPDPRIHTAQTQFFSLDLQREIARNTIVDIGYSGAHGVHLYDINNINQLGAAQVYLGASPNIGNPECNPSNLTPTGACVTRANSQYAAINDRGSRGSSSYNAVNFKFQTQNLHNTGVSLVANYTWAHSLDDESSTFSDSLQGGSGDIGSLGYTDLMNPKLDWGNSDFDITNRVVISPIWETPWYKSGRSAASEAFGGWSLVGIFTARSGVPFNVYDYDNVLVGYTVPRLTPATTPDYHVSSNPAAIGPNQFGLLSVPVPASFAPLNPTLGISDFGPFPANMTARNAFRGPGAWNLDTAVGKKFRLTERYGMEFRAEGFNVFNHHNMYVNTPSLLYGGPTSTPLEVVGLKGGLNTLATGGNHDERRFGQFSLRFSF
jgi:Carboxypeptidase regulatory-like domain/TonB dependent receptor